MRLIYQSCDKLQFDDGDEILDCYAADAIVKASIVEFDSDETKI